jgi:transposase-like protein
MAWEDEAGDGELVEEGEVTCPYCGEPNVVGLDPGGGGEQEYVEDCQVCCRPWVVHVRFDEAGSAEVWVEAADE